MFKSRKFIKDISLFHSKAAKKADIPVINPNLVVKSCSIKVIPINKLPANISPANKLPVPVNTFSLKCQKYEDTSPENETSKP